MGSDGAHILSMALRTFLVVRGINFLSQLVVLEQSTMWQQGWVSGTTLGIPLDLSREWADYLTLLRSTHTRLSAWADSLIWAHHTLGKYSPKHIIPITCIDITFPEDGLTFT